MRVERSPDRRSYRSTAGWKPILRSTETVNSSSGASRTVTIERTEWGPLLPADAACPASIRAKRSRCAGRRMIPRPRTCAGSSSRPSTSCDRRACAGNTIGGPVQNFVCADATGNVGWTLLGRIPLRGAGYDADGARPTGRSPMPVGRDGAARRITRASSIRRPVGSGPRTTASSGRTLAVIGDGSPDRGARAQQIRDDLFALGPAVRPKPTCSRSSSTSGRCFSSALADATARDARRRRDRRTTRTRTALRKQVATSGIHVRPRMRRGICRCARIPRNAGTPGVRCVDAARPRSRSRVEAGGAAPVRGSGLGTGDGASCRTCSIRASRTGGRSCSTSSTRSIEATTKATVWRQPRDVCAGVSATRR